MKITETRHLRFENVDEVHTYFLDIIKDKYSNVTYAITNSGELYTAVKTSLVFLPIKKVTVEPHKIILIARLMSSYLNFILDEALDYEDN